MLQLSQTTPTEKKKIVVSITQTRHWTVSPNICQFKCTTCSANVPFIHKQCTYKYH